MADVNRITRLGMVNAYLVREDDGLTLDRHDARGLRGQDHRQRRGSRRADRPHGFSRLAGRSSLRTLRVPGGSSCRLTISHSPRSRSDGTRREDRHLKFYEPRDNLRLLDAGTVFSELPRHHPCLSIFPGCALSGLRAVLRRERHGSRVGRSLTARTAGRISECPPGEMDESEIGFPKISRGPAKAGSL